MLPMSDSLYVSSLLPVPKNVYVGELLERPPDIELVWQEGLVILLYPPTYIDGDVVWGVLTATETELLYSLFPALYGGVR